MVLLIAMLAGALASDEAQNEAPHSEHHALNHISLMGVYAYHLNKSRGSGDPNAEPPESDNMGGFLIAYERVLLSQGLSFFIAKPFLFGQGIYNSPFELSIKGFRHAGRFEPFIAAGVTFNVRVFDKEREEIEGRPNDLSIGPLFTLGHSYWATHRWAVELELAYAWIPIGNVAEHELSVSMGVAHGF